MRIAENRCIEILFQSLDDLGRVFEFHIRHRQRHDIVRKVRNLLPHFIPFAGADAIARNQRFKIVFHLPSLSVSKSLRGIPALMDLRIIAAVAIVIRLVKFHFQNGNAQIPVRR